MGNAMIRIAAVVMALAIAVLPAFAADIERACLTSERGHGKRTLCGCIQDAANLTLTARDQRLAASFFSDPDRAQAIRQSKSRGHSDFWKRYKNFGATAETFCRG